MRVESTPGTRDRRGKAFASHLRSLLRNHRTRIDGHDMTHPSFVSVVLAVAGVATLLVPHSRLAGQEGFRFLSGVELVNVTATVTDRSGHFVAGLTQADFTVYEDDRPVDVAHFSAERVPVSLGIVLDTSGSMAGDKIVNARAAIERFSTSSSIRTMRCSSTGLRTTFSASTTGPRTAKL